jgi:HSP20 family protein
MLQRRNHFSPFSELRQMQENMDRMWRRLGTVSGEAQTGIEAWAAPLDVVAEGDDFVVRASMPGVSPENIQVSIEDGVLTVRGETASRFATTEGNYLMRERRSGSFRRSLRLPDTVDQDKAEPRYEHGVLTVTLPKAEAKRAKQFEVKVAEGPAAVEGS